MRREKCSRFCSDKVPKPASKEVPPGRQLANFNEALNPLGLLLYEPNRDIYITGFSELRQGQVLLFAQSASSGRQLPPLIHQENALDEFSCPGVIDYAMSEDGRYLGVIYVNLGLEKKNLTLIWEIESTLNFTRRMQAFPWARVIHSSRIDKRSYTHLWYSHYVAFDQGVCYTPNGLVRTDSGVESLVGNNPLQRLSDKIAHEFREVKNVIYSGNGQFLFVSSETTITKYTFLDLDVRFKMSLSGKTNIVECSSHSGRYLALLTRDQSQSAFSSTQIIKISLVDTLSDKTILLPHVAGLVEGPVSWHPRSYFGLPNDLHFSVDEKELVACFIYHKVNNPALLKVYHYAGLPSDVYLKAHSECSCDPVLLSTRMTTFQDHKAVHYITASGEIQRISLGDEIKFFDVSDKLNEYPSQATFLSQDGSRWAGVYYGNDNAQVQIYTVLRPADNPQCTELQRTSFLSDANTTFLTMSKDLSVMILDREVHSLNISKFGELGGTVQTLKLPRNLGFSQNPPESCSRYCSVDSSNEFVAYFTRDASTIGSISKCPDSFAIFHINFDQISSCQLQPSLPEDMAMISADFHPSIPLLIIGFSLVPEALVSGPESTPYHIVLIDMNTMSKRAVDVGQTWRNIPR